VSHPRDLTAVNFAAQTASTIPGDPGGPLL